MQVVRRWYERQFGIVLNQSRLKLSPFDLIGGHLRRSLEPALIYEEFVAGPGNDRIAHSTTEPQRRCMPS